MSRCHRCWRGVVTLPPRRQLIANSQMRAPKLPGRAVEDSKWLASDRLLLTRLAREFRILASRSGSQVASKKRRALGRPGQSAIAAPAASPVCGSTTGFSIVLNPGDLIGAAVDDFSVYDEGLEPTMKFGILSHLVGRIGDLRGADGSWRAARRSARRGR